MRYFVFMFILAVCIQKFQRMLDGERFSSSYQQERYFLPNAKLLKISVMGHDEAVADLLWLRSILISSDFIEDCEEKEGKWLFSMLNAIVYLEPRWKSVYHYGGLMMSLCNDISASDVLYEKGFQIFPEEGRFAFLLSTNASTEHKDNERALFWMKKAAAAPNAAPWYSAAVAGLIKKEDGLESSIAYIKDQLATMPPSPIRDYTEERYRLLVHDSLVIEIEQQRKSFIAQMGREPISVQELNIEQADPYEAMGGKWVRAEDGQIRSSIIETKELRKAQKQEKELLRLAE